MIIWDKNNIFDIVIHCDLIYNDANYDLAFPVITVTYLAGVLCNSIHNDMQNFSFQSN